MATFPSLTEHQQLVFWTELLVVLAVARALGGFLRRIGQPAVVGELLSGVLLGPAVLGTLWPRGFGWLFPTGGAQAGALNAIGWLGIALLLVLTGFETDLGIVRRLGPAAASVATGALVLPLGCGVLLGLALPPSFAGGHSPRAVFVLFMAVVLSISSLPVIAKILGELGLMRRDLGQVTVAVGMVNDLVGWLALGIISGLAGRSGLSPGHLALTIGAIVLLLAGGLTAGQHATNALLRRVRTRSDQVGDSLVAVVLVVLAVAVLAQAAGVEAVLGAYVAGIVLGRSRFRHEQLKSHLESVTYGLLAPVFFATAGLKLDLGALVHGDTALWCALILAVAVGTKFAGAYVGGRFGRLPHREGVALGTALNARGAVEVVIATVGLSIGVLSRSAFTAVVLMAILTSVMAPPLLRAVLKNWRGTRQEQERLEHESLLERNLLVRAGRLLLPSLGRPSSIVAAQILHYAWPLEVGVSVLSVHGPEEEPDLGAISSVFDGREVEFRHVADEEAMATLLQEARLGYQAIGLGAAEAAAGRLLSPVVDELLAESPIPLVIVRRARRQRTATPSAFACAVVPVSGSPSSRAAQEVAFSLSASLGTQVVLTHVVNRPDAVAAAGAGRPQARGRPSGAPPTPPVAPSARGLAAGDSVLQEAVGLAREFDVSPRTHWRSGMSTGEEILTASRELEADLIVLGATVRRLNDRPFLGHDVEHVLEHAEATVVIVTTPGITHQPPGHPGPRL